jgi:hypothetical protein
VIVTTYACVCVLDDVTFVDAKTGAPLGDAEKRTTMRALLDGEVGVRVVGRSAAPKCPCWTRRVVPPRAAA